MNKGEQAQLCMTLDTCEKLFVSFDVLAMLIDNQ